MKSLTTQTLNEISIYKGQLSQICLTEQTGKILQAFPKMEIAMFKLLKERFKANGFNDERLKAAVGHVIDNYEGWDKLPNIANFIQYDKTVKIYSYKEAIEFGMDDLGMIDVGLEKPRWCLKEYIEMYKLNKWEAK